MKKMSYLWLYVVALITTLSSCQAVEGVFKAGFYTAFIVIIIVVGLIIWLVSRSRR